MKMLFFALFLFSVLLHAKQPANDIKTKKAELKSSWNINSEKLFDVIESQLKALRAKEIDKAYNDYTSTEFRKNTTLESFKAMISKFKSFSNNRLFQSHSFYVENEIATFGGDLLSEEGESIPVEYDFVMENGKWKILGIQIYQNELSLPP